MDCEMHRGLRGRGAVRQARAPRGEGHGLPHARERHQVQLAAPRHPLRAVPQGGGQAAAGQGHRGTRAQERLPRADVHAAQAPHPGHGVLPAVHASQDERHETVPEGAEALDGGSAGQADSNRTARLRTSLQDNVDVRVRSSDVLAAIAVLQVEDARATLELYKREQYAWEKYLRTNKSSSSLVGVAPALPEKDAGDDAVKALPAAAKAHLDSDDEEIGTGRGIMAVPDSKELAIMEYGE
ncbi:hypothetical protein ON010_g15768 [Phytophthora cinnamomi]|nr:hypothetical protein ON010_g15768 [Phytophthora cinnamomi]